MAKKELAQLREQMAAEAQAAKAANETLEASRASWTEQKRALQEVKKK